MLIGGAPLRVLRLTDSGAAMIDAWAAGAPVAPTAGAQALATRLLDGGLAHPRPDRHGPNVPGPDQVTVVIPVLDNPGGLTDTLAALDVRELAGVVVVDDGSAVPFEAPPGVTVVRHERTRGPGAARNTGAAHCDSEIVVFIDTDCTGPPGWIDGLLPHFSDPTVGAVAPRVRSRPGPATPAVLAGYEEKRSPLDLGPLESDVHPGGAVPYVPSAALAVRAEAIRRAGGFDESLRFGEDVDLVWRLRREGWRVRYEPSVTVAHPARPGYGAWLEQRYHYGQSAAALAARHGRAVAPLAASPWSCAAWALLVAGYPAAAAAFSAGTAAALGRRAGSDRSTARALAGLAVRGNLQAGKSLGEAVRRAWLPFAVAAVVAGGGPRSGSGRRSGPGRRLAGAVVVGLIADPVAEWIRTRPATTPPTWVALRLADDLSYQAGVWRGMLACRSLGAVLPRW